MQKTILDAFAPAANTRINRARRAPRCAYVKINGIRCGSPALHRHRLCFFHNRMHLPRPNGAPFPPLEDGAAIQYALMTVLQDLRDKKIDHRTAGLLLYGLQTASFNLRQSSFSRGDAVRSDPGDLLSPEGAPLLAVVPSKSPRSQRLALPFVGTKAIQGSSLLPPGVGGDAEEYSASTPPGARRVRSHSRTSNIGSSEAPR